MPWLRFTAPGSNAFVGQWWGIFIVLAIVDLILRGLALWRSARVGQKWWFIALLGVNSMGILPGIYLLTHRSKKK